jgi:uncharacterized protein (TIGR02246 family)
MKPALVLAGLALSVPAALHAAPQPSSLEQRVQRLEDTLAIERLIDNYAATLDARDLDGYAALFAKDGVWQTGNSAHRGPAEIKAMLVGIFGTPGQGFVNTEDYHLVSNVEVELVDGDHAKARSRYLYVMRGDGGSPRPVLAGRYEDEFVREGGQWKILRRTDYPVIPTAAEWLKQAAALRPEK